jgi:hypothetical protein
MPDHVHRCLSILPKYSVANAIGRLKGKSAIRIHRIPSDQEGNAGHNGWIADTAHPLGSAMPVRTGDPQSSRAQAPIASLAAMVTVSPGATRGIPSIFSLAKLASCTAVRQASVVNAEELHSGPRLL